MDNLIIVLLVLSFGLLCGIIIAYWNLQNFPKPTGIYGVGLMQKHLSDSNRSENNAENTHRELMLYFWYPTSKSSQLPQSRYNCDAWSNTEEFITTESHLPSWLFWSIKYTKTYAQKNNPIADNQNCFPVIIISHGAGPTVQGYSWLAEELASQGYIVIGINHPYMAGISRFPDGRVIKSLLPQKRKEGKESARKFKDEQLTVAIEDVKFVLDKVIRLNNDRKSFLYNKLDVKKIGIVGHSAAGHLAMRMCLEDRRIKAGIALDGGTRGNPNLIPIPAPFLVLLGEKSRDFLNDYKKIMLINNLTEMNMNVMIIPRIGHGAFTDLGLLLHSTMLTQLLSKFIKVDVDASSVEVNKAVQNIKPIIANFFDDYLKAKE